MQSSVDACTWLNIKWSILSNVHHIKRKKMQSCWLLCGMLLDFPAGSAPQASCYVSTPYTCPWAIAQTHSHTSGRITPTTHVYTHLLIKWVALLKIPLLLSSPVHYTVSGSLLSLSNNSRAHRDLTCLMEKDEELEDAAKRAEWQQKA